MKTTILQSSEPALLHGLYLYLYETCTISNLTIENDRLMIENRTNDFVNMLQLSAQGFEAGWKLRGFKLDNRIDVHLWRDSK
jgi:hypothetical protein